MKLLGREPAVIIGAIGALITLLVSLQIPGLNAGQGAALTSTVTALIIAATTRPIAPALFTAVVAPTVALFAEYGMHVDDSVTVALTSVILAGFTLFGVRPQVWPKQDVPRAGDPVRTPYGP